MPGRNDPCTCGSGKKYKKCCLEKDEAAATKASQASQASQARAAAASPSWIAPSAPPPARLPRPKDPEEERMQALFTEIDGRFNAADLDGKILVFKEGLANPDYWSDESALQLLEPLHGKLARAGRRQEFAPLVAMVKSQTPEVFEEVEDWLTLWMVENALALADTDALRTCVLRMADLAAEHVDAAHTLPDLLRWHGDVELLDAYRKRAMAGLEDSGDALEEFGESFVNELSEEILFAAQARGEPVDAASKAVARVTALVPEPDPGFEAWRARLEGAHEQQWTLADLRIPAVAQPVVPPDDEVDGHNPAFDHLRDLLAQFGRHAWKARGVPRTRGSMMATEIWRYLVERADGFLGPRVDMYERMARTKKFLQTKPFPKPAHVLCPDQNTLLAFATRYDSTFEHVPYRAAALLAGLPLWLEFLRERGLADAQQLELGMAAVGALRPALAMFLERSTDVQLVEALGKAS